MDTFFSEIVRFRNARMWQRELKAEADPKDDDFREVLARYVLELRYRLGVVEPYADELHRLSELKRISRGLGPIYDGLAQYADEFPILPPAAQQLLDFLNCTAMDLAYKIHAIEELHSDRAEEFRIGRERFALTLTT